MSTLRQGSQAPNFEARTYDGKTVRLSDYLGKKVWLCFYRYAKCPLCNDHLHQVMQEYAALTKDNLEVIAIFESEPAQFPKHMSSKGFPIVADPKKKIYDLYHLSKSFFAVVNPKVIWAFLSATAKGYLQTRVDGDLGQIPAHFLIREDGIIHTAYYGAHIADQIPWWIVKRFANEESVADWKQRTSART